MLEGFQDHLSVVARVVARTCPPRAAKAKRIIPLPKCRIVRHNSLPNLYHTMNPISHVKLFRGGRLPDLDEPLVVVTFEQTAEDFFSAEYFILFQKSQRLDPCRLLGTENVKEYLELRTPEGVIEEMVNDARAEIEKQVVESLPQQQQYQWILGPAYTLTPIAFEELHALWFRGRVEEPIRQMAAITQSEELKKKLNRILKLPKLKFKEEKPSSRPPP